MKRILKWIAAGSLAVLTGCGQGSERAGEDVRAGHAGHAHGEVREETRDETMTTSANGDEIAYYTCPMHPSVKESKPGQCPICGMDLTPVEREELETGVIFVDAVRRQRIGVRTERAERAPMHLSVRAVGEVDYDASRLHDLTLRVEGWIEKLHADRPGMYVRKGEPLAEVYSPMLLAAQEEFLQGLNSGGALGSSARERLALLGLLPGQVEELEKRGRARSTVSILAPVSGYVVEKDVVEGAHVTPGRRLFRLAALDTVWVEAEVHEADLPRIQAGMPAKIGVTQLPGRSLRGKVDFVYPYLQEKTRNGRIRIELPNPDGTLRPGMYADVTLEADVGEVLQIPVSAVVFTGPYRLVFVDLGEGRLVPREVTVGHRSGERYQVLEGLEEGETVVTSGNFLIAAESRIRSAVKYWGGNVDDEQQ